MSMTTTSPTHFAELMRQIVTWRADSGKLTALAGLLQGVIDFYGGRMDRMKDSHRKQLTAVLTSAMTNLYDATPKGGEGDAFLPRLADLQDLLVALGYPVFFGSSLGYSDTVTDRLIEHIRKDGVVQWAVREAPMGPPRPLVGVIEAARQMNGGSATLFGTFPLAWHVGLCTNYHEGWMRFTDRGGLRLGCTAKSRVVQSPEDRCQLILENVEAGPYSPQVIDDPVAERHEFWGEQFLAPTWGYAEVVIDVSTRKIVAAYR